ncbi:MAG: transposase [Chlamydiota bacterium]
MSHLKHHLETGAAYSVTSATAERNPLFNSPSACRFFLTCMDYQKQIFGFRLYGFVIMPDHVHCLIQPLNGIGISTIMKYLKGNFARKYNLIANAKGHVWQRKFYLRGIRGVPQLLRELEYCHNNPVRAELVTSPAEYAFSSYHYYHGNAYRGMIDRFDGGSSIPSDSTGIGHT